MDTAIDLQRDWLQAYWLSVVDLWILNENLPVLFREVQESLPNVAFSEKEEFLLQSGHFSLRFSSSVDLS
jgi:hypothetical protein